MAPAMIGPENSKPIAVKRAALPAVQKIAPTPNKLAAARRAKRVDDSHNCPIDVVVRVRQ